MATTALVTTGAPLDQTLVDLEGRLNTAKAKGSVPFDGPTLGPPGAAIAAGLLTAFGAPLTLTKDAAIGPGDGDSLVVSGPLTSAVLGITSPPQATATFTTMTDASGATVLDVCITIPAGGDWTFAHTFPNLATTGLGQLAWHASPTFVFRGSDGALDKFGPAEPAGLNLRVSADANTAGPLALIANLVTFESGAVLNLTGPVATGAKRESVRLRAPSGGSDASIGVAGLPTVAALTSTQVSVIGTASLSSDGTTWSSALGQEVWGLVSLGAGTVPFGVAIPTGAGAWRLFVPPGAGVRLLELLDLVPGLSLLDHLPDQVKSAVNGEIEALSFTLPGADKSSLGLQSMQVMVSATETWPLIPGAVELKGVTVTLNVAWPGPTVTGSVAGTIALDAVAGHEVDITVTLPIPLTSGPLTIYASPQAKLPGLGALTTLVGGASLTESLPAGVADVGSFTLNSIAVAIDLSKPALSSASISLGAEQWVVIPGTATAPDPRLAIEGIAIDFTADMSGKTTKVTGSVAGTFDIAGTDIAATVGRAEDPGPWELEITADDVALPSLDSIAHLAGGSFEDALPADIAKFSLVLTRLDIKVDLSARKMEVLRVVVTTGTPWPIIPGQLEIEQVTAALDLDWTSGALVKQGSISSVIEISDLVQLGLSAERKPDATWVLSGKLEKPVSLDDVLKKALGFAAPDGLANLSVNELSLTYDTGTKGYAFAGGAAWTPDIPGLQLEIDASVHVDRKPVTGKAGQFAYGGQIKGELKSHFGSDTLGLSMAYQFQQPTTGTGKPTTSYLFELDFNKIKLMGGYTTAANGDGIVTLKLGGVTFGDIVGYLVHLADPSHSATLDAPWNVLDKINFDDLELIVNVTQRTVGIKDTINLDLGLVNIKWISLTYVNKGGSPTVDIAISGSFLGEEYPDEKPLDWDLMNEDPPAAPGAGAALLDLKDLGVGQHLVLAPGAKTMPDVLKQMHEIVAGAEQKDAKPWEILHFDAQAGWLIGANFTVMGTVSLGVVFNDPVLYGAQITLSGPKAGPFDGLYFQILYRKVSADVGVYHIELQLPTLMRHLEFGEVSITLPNLTLDIYTDGGFYIDLGFPYNNDWSVAFGLEIFPFVGAGGFYFGRLTAADGATDLVPQISNGTFGPVVEFGVALALGVGKDISEGPLSAGVSVTVQGIVTGVVAWFNPTGSSVSSDRYYKITGSLAIVGKLYGSVDFKVLSISISITASVTASVVIEAYAPIYLGLSVDVEVEASIKILFIRIHFSFSMHMDASFTIGSQQATPWTLGAPPAAPAASAGTPALSARARMETPHHLLAAAPSLLGATAATPPPLQWAAATVLPSTAVLDVTLVPVFTVAPDPSSGADVVTITMTPSTATTPPSTSDVPTPIANVVPQPFDVLVQLLLKWGMNTLIGATTGAITAVDLHQIFDDLSAPDISQRGFDYGDVQTLLADNLVLALRPPDPAAASDNADDEMHGAVLPMPPPLTMAPDAQPAVDFSALPIVGDEYQSYVQGILDQLAVNYGYDRAPDPLNGGGNGVGTVRTMLRDGGEPVTEALFADWLLMIARSSFQVAINELKATRYDAAAATDSLASIAAAIAPDVKYTVRQGDTPASIAHLFGIPTAALVARNAPTVTPGQVLTVPPPMAVADYIVVAGDTLASIATAWCVGQQAITDANPSGTDFTAAGTPISIPVPAALFDIAAANLATPLAAVALPIPGLTYGVLAGDSLSGVATKLRQTDGGVAIAAANAHLKGVLLANGTATVQLARADGTGAQYTVAADDSLALIAAYAIVRDLGAATQPEAAWFANAIATANAAVPEGQPWTIPTVVRTPAGPLQQTGTVAYTPKKGDTYGLVAGYFTLTQLYPDALTATMGQISALNPGVTPTHVPAPGTPITLPVRAHTIVVGDTLGDLAGRFGLDVSDLAAQAANATAAILTPNVTLALPAGLQYPVAQGTTIQGLASALGLTVDALAGRIGGVQKVFAAGTAVPRPNARQADVDDLFKRLVGSGETATVSGMSSHFMLHGLRLPMPPDPKTGTVEAFYRVTGQQFPAPATIATTYNVNFTLDGAPGWVQPVAVHATQGGETVAVIAGEYNGVTVAEIVALNPGIDVDHPPATVRVPQPVVDVTIDQPTLTAQSPLTTFDPQITSGPQREALFHAAPIAHSVGPQVPWAAPDPPNLLSHPLAGGSPSLWRLPPSLLDRVASGQVSGDFLLAQSPKGKQVADPPPPVESWAWATVLPFTVRRIASPAGGWLDGTYLALGADQTDRDTLLALWTHLQASGEPVQLYLAYAAAGSGAGLVSDPLTAADRAGRVAMLKSNLSTETHSGPAAAAALAMAQTVPPFTDAYASLAAPVQFLQLLWEASVTGTGGFYLNYTTAAGTGLPASAFPGGEDGQVYLVAVTGSPKTPDLVLRPYVTAAVVADNLDPSKVDVFAYAKSGDTTVVTTAPPGNIGFSLARTDPSPGAAPTAEERTESLFSLLSFTLTGTGFQQPSLALPEGPKSGETGVWEYTKTVPVYKLVTAVPADLAALLPPGGLDPYAGIAKDAKATGPFKGATVDLAFAFRDVFGNEIDATPEIAHVEAPVGYYDALRGVGAWPSASGHYDVSGASGAAVLTVRLDLGLGKYVPSPSNLFASAVRTAAAHQAIYGQVHYQLTQPDVTCSIDTSLDPPAQGSLVSGAAAKRPLEAFVMASYLYLGAAQSVQQLEHVAGSGETLGGVAGDSAVTPGQLMVANGAAEVTQLTSAPVVIPHDYAVRASDTLGAIAAATGITVGTLLANNETAGLAAQAVLPTATWTYTTRAENKAALRPADTFTTVAALQSTTIAAVAVANTDTPHMLVAGSTVTIDSVALPVGAADTLGTLVSAFADHGVKTSVAAIATAYANAPLLATGVPIAIANVPATPGDTTGVRPHKVVAGEKLGDIATNEDCTLAALALANAELPGLLAAGGGVEVKGISVTVGGDGSLLSVLDQLLEAAVVAGASAPIGLVELAGAIAKDATILAGGVTLAIADYVVQPKDTLSSLAGSLPGFTVDQLARLAAPGPTGVFPPTTSLRISTSTYTAEPGDTFTGIAARFGISVDELAGANATLSLTTGAVLAIPGAVSLGTNTGAALYVPMGPKPVPTLAGVVKAFGTDGATLGVANATMPGLLAPDVDVVYGQRKTTTTAASTLASVAVAVGAADAGALVSDAGVAALAGLVAPGALFVGTAPPVGGRTLDGVAQAMGVLTPELATANSAVAGLVPDGKAITVAGKTVTAHATDTLASIVRKLEALDPSIGLADLVAAYAGDASLFASGARLLVPPPEVSAGGGLAAPYVASPFTPLDASITIARDASLVDPLATDIAAVASDTTPLAPNLGPDGRPDVFAAAFETAYAERRLKLATGPQPGDGAKRLWVLDFGAAGVSQVQIDPATPRFYAVRPMSQQLESGDAQVGDYQPATGTLAPAASKTFSSVDIDAWMRMALEAIDLFLSPAVAARAWTVNPAAFTEIVEAKQTIAGELAAMVDEILADDDPAGLDQAMETMRQSMLVSLATAYTTDAVIQFPVAVSSPFRPPHTTGGTAESLKQLAAAYGPSPEAVATAFADVANVLALHVVVANGDVTHTIVAGDTLAGVAKAVGFADVTQLPPDQGLFAPDKALDLVPLSRPTAAGETFASLAAYFATDPGSVGTAVQDVTNLLTPGTTISSYKVLAGDTLRGVARTVGSTAAAIAEELATAGGVLVAGTPVACFSPLNPVPPRLAGKPVAPAYQVPPGGDIGALVKQFAVSLETLAGAIGGASGILTPKVVVGGSYTVSDTDSLATVGAGLKPKVGPAALLAGVEAGTIAVTGGTLLREGAALALGKVARTPTASDSFETLARYFGVDPGDVAVANQDASGTLAPAVEFVNKATSKSYTTTGAETIADVATALAYDSVAGFAADPDVAARTGIFNTTQALHGLQSIPDFSLSTLKVPLADGQQYASFLFSTGADARYRNLYLELDLKVDEVEFRIEDVPGALGYQGSDWLRFALPLEHEALGGAVKLDALQTDVPIALRSYPQLPLVRALDAEATWGSEAWPVTSIAEAKQWQLEATVDHQASAQDEMRLQVTFGAPGESAPAPASPQTLLQPLAQVAVAWPEMQHDVSALAALGAGVQDARLGAMVDAFAGMVKALANALTTGDETVGETAARTHEFTLDTTYDATDTYLESVEVKRLDGPTDDIPWPAIFVKVDGVDTQLDAGGVIGGESQRYTYPPDVKAFAPLTQRFVFPGTAIAKPGTKPPPAGRDAVQWQQGQVLVSVLRNALLVPDTATNPSFVYQTSWIGFTNPAVPLLQTAAAIGVGTGPGIAAGLTAALQQLIGGEGDQVFKFRVLCRYERELAAPANGNGADRLVAPLPVFYVPLAQHAAGDLTTFVTTADAQAAAWLTAQEIVPAAGDAYVFDISVYANDDTQMTRPLVEVSRLTVPMA